ncbi:MAG: OsmC family protein [Sediminibacterium sp.]|nr:OsmC family protein [Sediminibacterium sp.]
MTTEILYEGNLRTNAIHLQSGTKIETDAPTDNKGLGARFSPTDLVVTALGTCMLTTMAIKAQSLDIELKNTKALVKKYMGTEPRRIVKIEVEIIFPTDLNIEEKTKTILEHTARVCPVERSLHPDIKLDIIFKY